MQVRPERVQQRLDQRDDRGLLRRHRPQPAREQPVRQRHLQRAEHRQHRELRRLGAVTQSTKPPGRPSSSTNSPSVTARAEQVERDEPRGRVVAQHAQEQHHDRRTRPRCPTPMNRIDDLRRAARSGGQVRAASRPPRSPPRRRPRGTPPATRGGRRARRGRAPRRRTPTPGRCSGGRSRSPPGRARAPRGTARSSP